MQSWRVPFDQAAATLAKAHDQLGNVTLDQTGEILAKGGDAAKTWVDASTAAKTIDRILLGWSALGEFTHRVSRDRRWNVLRLAAVDPAAFGALNYKTTPWEAILAGATLSLPTFDEYHARVRVIEQHLATPVTAVDTERSSIAGREIRVPVA